MREEAAVAVSSSVQARPGGLPRVAVVVGDPAGIAPELTAHILADPGLRSQTRLIAVGDSRIVAQGASDAGLPFDLPFLDRAPHAAWAGPAAVLEVRSSEPREIERSKATAAGGRSSLANLRAALRLARNGEVDGIVYTPFNKSAAALAEAHYEDDVSIMAEELGVESQGIEFNVIDGFWNARVTSHIPLSQVASSIRGETVLAALRRTHLAMRAAGLTPRIAVAGLNPHAGEHGKFGMEEIREIAPAVALARREGIDCIGPLPPDTVFLTAKREGCNAVQTMYHDQGQIAMKLMGFERGVTLISGFPIPIATPAHGTAYDIAGQGRANPGAALMAASVVASIAASRIAG